MGLLDRQPGQVEQHERRAVAPGSHLGAAGPPILAGFSMIPDQREKTLSDERVPTTIAVPGIAP